VNIHSHVCRKSGIWTLESIFKTNKCRPAAAVAAPPRRAGAAPTLPPRRHRRPRPLRRSRRQEDEISAEQKASAGITWRRWKIFWHQWHWQMETNCLLVLSLDATCAEECLVIASQFISNHARDSVSAAARSATRCGPFGSNRPKVRIEQAERFDPNGPRERTTFITRFKTMGTHVPGFQPSR
jgi:hypothetical protein